MAVAHDASSTFNWTSGTSVSFSHTCAAGADLLLWVGWYFDAFTSLSSVQYAGSAMTLVGTVVNGTNQRLSLYKHESPSTGANNITFTLNDTTGLALSAIAVSATSSGSITGGTTAGPTGSTTPSVTIPSVGAGDMAYAASLTLTDPTESDTLVAQTNGASDLYLSVQRQAAGGDGVINWTTGVADTWLANGARFVDAGGGSRTTFNTNSHPHGIARGINRGIGGGV